MDKLVIKQEKEIHARKPQEAISARDQNLEDERVSEDGESL